MHQHPRPPPVTASPATSEQTNPTRTSNPRDREQHLRAASPLTQGSNSSEEFAPARQENAMEGAAAQVSRLNQVIQNFHTKAALIILHSRMELSPAYSKGSDLKRINKWFNIELEETEEYKEDIRRWRTCDLKDNRPPPLVIEILLNTDTLNASQRLVILDEDGKRWDVLNALASSQSSRRDKRRSDASSEVILERWTIQLGDTTAGLPPDLASVLPLVYKKSIVLFRSLYTYCNFLPAWKLSKNLGKVRSKGGLKLSYRFLDGSQMDDKRPVDHLTVPLCDSTRDAVENYTFGITDSPAGPFSVRVAYRLNCDFRVDDSEALLSSRFAGSDDDLFRPSLPQAEAEPSNWTRDSQEVGSLPVDHRQNLMQRPELGQAYGSMSTFHQAGIKPSTSPMSTLRRAQDYGVDSPPEPAQTAPRERPTSLKAGIGGGTGRRTSFSFQPFKAPVLSASPMNASPLGSSPRTSAAKVPTLGSLTEESSMPPPRSRNETARKAMPLASEPAVASSSSNSPKQPPNPRFSSSFSHRRARLSLGGSNPRAEDDQNSSGKGSATSSAAQPGSGLIAEAAGGSSGSMQEDDENISSFLKMLDTKKNLLSPHDAAAAEASTRRTTAALNKFHRMRDTNAALSDSMSSSLMMQRSSSSSSRQLSSVPPMVPPTSVSTSSSPGKPISPHTPHTPFAPSRLSAAYSHDDPDVQRHLTIEEEPPSPSEATTSDETAQARSTANVTAIDIPNSPRPFVPNYRRSSSAQRRPLPEDDDIGDLYGMRSASMGAPPDRKASRKDSNTLEDGADIPPASLDQNPDADLLLGRPNIQPRRTSQAHRTLSPAAPINEGPTSSKGHPSHSRPARTGLGRGATTSQTSTSSFGGTGASLERDRDSVGSADASTSSWGRGGRRGGGGGGGGSRAENKFDEDEFLPFAMEKSDLKDLPRASKR